MNGKTHALLGAATMAAVTIKYFSGFSILGVDITTPVAGMVTVVAGSYMPDIDMANSHMGNKHKFFSKIFTHRGFTHTLVIPIAIWMCMAYLSFIPGISSLVFGFVFGWLLHILADMCNGKGVPILWPLSSTKIHIMDIPLKGPLNILYQVIWLGGLIAWLLI